MSTEMMIDHNNLCDIFKISKELCQAFPCLVCSVPALAARAPDVQNRVEGSALKFRALPGRSQTAG
jgi:hypothetical protein